MTSDNRWRKSSYSGGSGGDCIEVADRAGRLLVRDTKDRAGTTLRFSSAAWRRFVGQVKTGALAAVPPRDKGRAWQGALSDLRVSPWWQKAAMPADSQPISFFIAGFDQDEPYGRIYGVTVPCALEPQAYCADFSAPAGVASMSWSTGLLEQGSGHSRMLRYR
jgi:hypothetical protein